MEAVEAPRTARARSVSEDLDELLQRAQRQLIFAFVQCFASSSPLSILFAIEETQNKAVFKLAPNYLYSSVLKCD